jgi:hypothetical protein
MHYGWTEGPEYYGLPKDAFWVTHGLDSNLWRWKSKAIHVYLSAPLSLVTDYQAVIREADDFLQQSYFGGTLGSGYTYRVSRTVRIDKVVNNPDWHDKTLVSTESEWQNGPNGREFEALVPWYETTHRNDLDPQEKTRLIDYYHYYHDKGGHKGFSRVISNQISSLNRQLARFTGFSGIRIVPLNYKVRSPENGQVDLVITDPCDALKELHPTRAFRRGKSVLKRS